MAKLREKTEMALHKLEVPWMILGFVYLGIYAFQVIAQPERWLYNTLEIVNIGIYVVFVIDLVIRGILVGKALVSIEGIIDFVKAHWLSILAVVLPAFRSLRVLRVVIVLRALEPYLLTRSHKLAVITGVTIPLLLFTSAVSVLEAEQSAEGANITSFPDAFWWALVSVTTVGYGDKFPVTDEGRLIATFLLVVGIGLFGALTALLASWVMSEKEHPRSEKST
ncbi:MAG: potassium channel family protein [Pontimonas sp.]